MGRLKIHQTSHGLGLKRHSALVGRIAVPRKVQGGRIDPEIENGCLFGRLALFLLFTQFHQQARTFRALEDV